MQTMLGEKQLAQTAISAENYAFLQRYIYQESGIVIDAGKNYLIESRLLPIVKQENLSTLNDLCSLLRATAPLQLKSRVVESMTTNETLFFRDLSVFDALQKEILPKLIEARPRPADKRPTASPCCSRNSGWRDGRFRSSAPTSTNRFSTKPLRANICKSKSTAGCRRSTW
jgi:hypothetical protein